MIDVGDYVKHRNFGDQVYKVTGWVRNSAKVTVVQVGTESPVLEFMVDDLILQAKGSVQ